MTGMELLQFHTLLYSALEEVCGELEAPAAFPRERKAPLFVRFVARGRGATGLV